MAPTVAEISEILSQSLSTAQSSDNTDGASSSADSSNARRTEGLKDALRAAEKAWLDVPYVSQRQESFEALALIAEKIADAARKPSWRLPVGESGVLDFFLSTGIFSAEGEGEGEGEVLPLELKKQALRLVGNACAECDENKARVVDSGKLGGGILRFLEGGEDALLAFAISVIYNICVDNEKAVLQACEAGLSKKLVGIISGPRFQQCQQSLALIIQLLEQLVSQDAESRVADLSTPSSLLRFANDPRHELDLEDFTALCTVALAYLTYEQFQTALVEADGFPVLQQAFNDTYTRFDTTHADPDVLEQLKRVRNAFVTIFADISAIPAFAAKYPLDSPVVQKLAAWLHSPASFTHLQTAACLSLGNLSRSDAASIALVQNLHGPLLRILSRAIPSGPDQPQPPVSERPPAQLLHAVLGIFKNLAIPQANKPILGSALLSSPQSILPNLWTTTTAQPQVQFAAVSLTRLLLVNNPPAVQQLCAPLSATTTYTTRDGPALSNLHILMDIALRADAEPTKVEVARAVCATVRVLHHHQHHHSGIPSSSSTTQEDNILSPSWTWDINTNTHTTTTTTPTPTTTHNTNTTTTNNETTTTTKEETTVTPRQRFYLSHGTPLSQILTNQLTQPKFPALRSESLFVLALMARFPDSGEHVVSRVLSSASACRVLKLVVTGKELELELEPNLENELLGLEESRVVDVSEELTATQSEKEKETAQVGFDTAALVDGLGLEPQQAGAEPSSAGTAKVDRENGLVLVAEVIRGISDALSPARKTLFERMLREGGELMIEERKNSPGHGA